MSYNSNSKNGEYYRAAIVTSEHPKKPLEGTVVAINTMTDFSISDPLCTKIAETATERFDIDKYAQELRIGTLYFSTDQEEFVGVCWEESPRPYSLNDFNILVEALPEQIILAEDLV
ncbi:hypothetical protein [Halorubrum tebenquichense]|uniref:hypothetical protein n=1 Tax=Halorubrum tebenquichense TaxID=119434 RepID=UPI00126836CB|nr:hypothetical protein [Halorubrum tebenquichense]